MATNTTPNHLYSKYQKQWSRIRNVLEGSDKIKAAGATYLPRLSGQSDSDYSAYVERATFFNMTARVFSSNAGMITRISPIVDFPTGMEIYNVDTTDFSSFYELFSNTVQEMLAIGSMGIMIDIVGDRPVPIFFDAENITNWTYDKRGLLNMVLLEESKYSDGFTQEDFRYKLYIDETHTYAVETFKDDVSQGSINPSYKGKTLDFIPFTGGNTKGLDIKPVKSPILDIVDMNISHYKTSADYEHGLHFVALPTPVITGATMENGLKLGASEGINIPSKDAKAYYLEFQGQGLDAIRRALSDKQSQISLFSARLQDTNTKGSEAENTVRLRYSADSASLTEIALSTQLIMNDVYSNIAVWLGIDNDVSIVVNKDFLSTKLTPAELKELAEAFLKGAMDEETYIFNLQRGELIRPGHIPRLPMAQSMDNNNTNQGE